MRCSIDDLHRVFIYDPLTGILTWRLRSSGSRGDAIFNSTHAGQTAGSPNQGGYLQVAWSLNGIKYKALVHRVAFAMANGYWPDDVDHENNVKTDNKKLNLRDSGKCGNNQNRSVVRAKLGFKGAFNHTASGKYFSQIRAAGKIEYLGIFDSAKDAAIAYDKAALRLHGKFARTNASLGLL